MVLSRLDSFQCVFTLLFTLSSCCSAVTATACNCGGQLCHCVLLEGTSNCQRGKMIYLVIPVPFLPRVVLHYCIAILQATNEKPEEWIPVSLKKRHGWKQFASISKQQALATRFLLSEIWFIFYTVRQYRWLLVWLHGTGLFDEPQLGDTG